MRNNAEPRKAAIPRRVFWTRQLYQWHWMSAALSLVGILGFAITGITLNHAAQITAEPRVETRESTLPAALLRGVQRAGDDGAHTLPEPIRRWLDEAFALRVGERPAQWSKEEIYLALPRAGGDAWLSIDRASGEVLYERTDRGWVAYLNDLHKGRDTGAAWRWFIDVLAAACIVFSATGVVLLHLHSQRRRSTWPLVGGGLLAPMLIAAFLLH